MTLERVETARLNARFNRTRARATTSRTPTASAGNMWAMCDASMVARARRESGSRATHGRAGASSLTRRSTWRSTRCGRTREGARALERGEHDASAMCARRSRALEEGEASGGALGGAWRRSLVGALAVALCATTAGGGVERALADDAVVVKVSEDARGAPVVVVVEEEATTATATAPSVSVDARPPKEEQKAEDGKKTDRRGRMRELQDLRSELEIKELELESKENELQKSDQTVQVLQQELELKTKLYELMKTERDKAIEESKLASGLCAQVGGF